MTTHPYQPPHALAGRQREISEANRRTEMALAAIYAALWPNAEQGWNAWNRYAANGEWQ